MKHIQEFSRFANSYDEHTLIQKEVAKKLVSMIQDEPQSILDLGCGSGAIYNNLPFTCKEFVGVDSAKNMCDLHVKRDNVKIINTNFESSELEKLIGGEKKFDLIVSSSALQWARDLDKVILFCKNHSSNILFAVFGSKTFDTVFKQTDLTSPLPSVEQILHVIQKHYEIEFEICNYKLYFKDNLSKFRYIKRSGVSGGERRLNITKTRDLIKNYPLDYLEFEVIYIKNK